MDEQPAPASRARMIEAAILLMRGSGLAGAGINEIVRVSAAPKGSVYHHFPQGKRQIVGEAIRVYADRVAAFIEAAMAAKRVPREKLRALFEAFARRAEEGGCRLSCAVGTVSLDLDEAFESLRDELDPALARWRQVIAVQLGFADRRRALSFAGLVLSAIEGAYVRTRAEGSAEAFREAGTWLAQLAEMQPVA